MSLSSHAEISRKTTDDVPDVDCNGMLSTTHTLYFPLSNNAKHTRLSGDDVPDADGGGIGGGAFDGAVDGDGDDGDNVALLLLLLLLLFELLVLLLLLAMSIGADGVECGESGGGPLEAALLLLCVGDVCVLFEHVNDRSGD